ncbi:hypothetical protein [Spirilliplanes yamanashiensis]|uniref:ASCH domain-containing protein n=1 Tax=Spirilliplanes yamanashiensis TaxID=42233 RepID=A0A8J3YBD2_9ACTN|nr:hypothetical protein [Spirilliplanes yamanashiensis]MDP9818041.1 hypothetical protein [Spirilliplanes yamanashiensis]GIJ04850.1 hypothetical protein Sya03_42020 [Spirilliplanes yamanashiensis]
MLFRAEALDAIRQGTVSLAFRRWRTARVRAGTRLRTMIGVVEVVAVTPVEPAAVTDADARRAGYAAAADLLADVPGDADRQLYRVELRHGGADPREALRGDVSEAALEQVLAALERMDRTGRRGPWTRTVLGLIADRPAVRAPDLAGPAGYADTLTFKRDVRRLKELGLTESLAVGYRLSPRGAAVLARLR